MGFVQLLMLTFCPNAAAARKKSSNESLSLPVVFWFRHSSASSFRPSPFLLQLPPCKGRFKDQPHFLLLPSLLYCNAVFPPFFAKSESPVLFFPFYTMVGWHLSKKKEGDYSSNSLFFPFFFFCKDDLLTSSPPPQPIFATGPKNASKVERKSERTKKKPPSLPLFSLSEKIPTILSRKKREVEEKRPNFSAKRAQGEGRGGGFCLPILRKTLFFLLLLLSLRPSPPPPSFPPLLNTKSLSRPQRGGRGEEKEREKGP